MINYDINYYRPEYASQFHRDTTWDSGGVVDTEPIADCIGDIWAYYYDGNPDNTDNRGNPLNDSIYLWKIAPEATVANNACVGTLVSSGRHFHVEVKNNRESSPVPLAMCLYAVMGGYADAVYRRNPKVRLAYDETFTGVDYGGWQKSQLLWNINPKKFCLNPRIAFFDYEANVSTSNRSLAQIKYDLDLEGHHRTVVLIRSDIMYGYDTPRTVNASYGQDTGVVCSPNADILTHRPICDVHQDTIGKYIKDNGSIVPHPEYDSSKVYSPFNQMMTTQFATSPNGYTNERQFDIGFYISSNVQAITNGSWSVPDNNGRAFGMFCKFSDEKHYFDDVVYHWRVANYFGKLSREVPDDYDLSSYFSENPNFKIFSELVIDDMKDSETYGEACKRAILHEIAYWGFWFAENNTKASTDPLGTETTGAGIYLPEKINGVTTGRYFTGDEIQDIPYADAEDISDFQYHDDAPPSSPDTLSMFPDEVMAMPRFGHTYKCDFAAVDALNRHLKAFDWSQENKDSLFFGQDPYDFIINITGYPMVYFPAPYRELENIVLGKLDLNDREQLPDLDPTDLIAQGNPIMGGHIIYDNPFGSIYVATKYTDPPYGMAFLDYEPYTTMFLYLPYAGMVSIPPSVFMGRTINVRMSVDLLSGTIVYFVCADSTFYCTAQGNCGTDIPVSGLDYSSFAERMEQLQEQEAQNRANTFNTFLGNVAGATISGALGNPAGVAIQMIMGMSNLAAGFSRSAYMDMEMDRLSPSPESISNGSAPLATASIQDALLIVNRPVLPSSKEFSASSFKKVMGKAANEVGPLRNYSGFTIVKNPILDGISCTAEEKALIIEALSQGVIL